MPSGATIREATPADAENLVGYFKALVGEPGICIPLTLDQIRSVAQQREAIEAFAESDKALLLIAQGGGKLVGEFTLKVISPRPQVSHVATLGMSVAADWRRKGVGAELLEAGLGWAPSAGIKRVELYVYARNAPAIALYERFGFKHEGRRRGYIREGDAYLDDLVMGLWLD